jgi:hypothetical protein
MNLFDHIHQNGAPAPKPSRYLTEEQARQIAPKLAEWLSSDRELYNKFVEFSNFEKPFTALVNRHLPQ